MVGSFMIYEETVDLIFNWLHSPDNFFILFGQKKKKSWTKTPLPSEAKLNFPSCCAACVLPSVRFVCQSCSLGEMDFITTTVALERKQPVHHKRFPCESFRNSYKPAGHHSCVHASRFHPEFDWCSLRLAVIAFQTTTSFDWRFWSRYCCRCHDFCCKLGRMC